MGASTEPGTGHHRIHYCTKGNSVTRWRARYDAVYDEDATVYKRGVDFNVAGGLGGKKTYSKYGRHIEQCVVRYGCYANHHPWTQMTVGARGYKKARGENR